MKSGPVAFILWCFMFAGFCGIHRFYLNRPMTGLLWLFTFGLFGVGQVIDLFLIGGMVREANLLHEVRRNGGAKVTNANNFAPTVNVQVAAGDLSGFQQRPIAAADPTPRLPAPASPRAASPLEPIFRKGLQRLSVMKKGTSMTAEVDGDEVSIEILKGDRGHTVVATRDIDEVSLTLDMVIPPEGHPKHEQSIAGFAKEVALQVEKRLPKMRDSVRERIWDRKKRVAARQAAPQLIEERKGA